MIKRHLQSVLLETAKHFPVLTLTGPRQSGKTTLAKKTFSKAHYISLEDPGYRDLALNDPRGFLDQFGTEQIILDEVQRVPELFSYIQGIVDDYDIPGQFILTGSQNFLLLEKISQSLAGRCSIHHLLPFSYSELLKRDPVNLYKLADQSVQHSRSNLQQSLFDVLWTGGYPRIHDKHIPPRQWLANYIQTYLERDVRSIVNVSNLEMFMRFIRLCAGRTGQLLNLLSLGTDCGIDSKTAKRWLSILETSFIVKLIRPYHHNFNKRLIKSPKLYFLDSGLLCCLLGIQKPDELIIHSSRGAIFESWVIAELYKTYYHTGQQPEIYFYRDSNNNEVDVVLDFGSSTLPIEIKSGKTINSEFFKGLQHWRTLAGSPASKGVLITGGDTITQFKGMSVLPWFAI